MHTKRFSYSITMGRWTSFKKIINQINYVSHRNFSIAVRISLDPWIRWRTSFEKIVYQINHIPN